MLITFKSKSSGNVLMFGDVAQQLLAIIGKPQEKQGIITVEQLPDAIQRLKQAMAKSKTPQTHARGHDEEAENDEQRPSVSIVQRAVPLLELLERSLHYKTPITWGA